MINKIKDFLGKLRKKKPSRDNSDQADFGDESTSVGLPSSVDDSDEFKVTVAKYRPRRTLKDKFTSSFNIGSLKSKIGGEKPLLGQNLNRTIEALIARSSREPIHQGFIVVIICCITYSLGKISALSLVATQKQKSDGARVYSISFPLDRQFNVTTLAQVKGINIFRTNAPGGKKKVADTRCEIAQQATGLPIKLVNTVVLQDSVKSMASVQVRGDRDLQEVREGDQISNMAKIFKISRLGLLIKNLENGICESVESDKLRDTTSPISVLSPQASREFKMNKKMSGIENVGNKFQISKTLLDEKLKDLGAILTQARAIKIQNPDGSLSFKMTELDPAGIFPYLGIQDQDIITSINGKPIYDMNEIMMLFGRIKNLDKLSLGIKREGSDSVQDYSIKK